MLPEFIKTGFFGTKEVVGEHELESVVEHQWVQPGFHFVYQRSPEISLTLLRISEISNQYLAIELLQEAINFFSGKMVIYETGIINQYTLRALDTLLRTGDYSEKINCYILNRY